MTNLLEFGFGNKKLDKSILTFAIPAGWTCPGAKLCLAKADPETGKIWNSPDQKFRCFSASSEAAFTQTRKQRWRNFERLRNKTKAQMRNLIVDSIKNIPSAKWDKCRVHVGGDFFNEAYLLAWLEAATHFSDKTFYAYTKSLKILNKHKDKIPENFKITLSEGGKYDDLIQILNSDFNKVVIIGHDDTTTLPIDHDDSHAFNSEGDFALVVHGVGTANVRHL